MDVSIILIVILFIILIIALYMLVSILSEQQFVISIERYTRDHRSFGTSKEPIGFISKFRQKFNRSSKSKQPAASDWEGTILNFTFKFTDCQNDFEEIPVTDELSEWAAQEEQRKVEQQRKRNERRAFEKSIQEKWKL